MKYLASILLVASFLSFVPAAVRAGGCFEDPVYERAWSATVSTGAFVRDVACMDGSVVLTTIPVGQKVNIIGETDGWYKVKTSAGTVGWVGQWLLSVTSTSGTQDLGTAPTPAPAPTTTYTDPNLTSRLKGYILLQVESHGEAWYLNPTDAKRYYMKDGPTAYEMMRAFGLGITDADLAKVQAGNRTLVSKLKGRILLQVQQHGEAYYVHPKDGSVTYMKDGAAAYTIMRELSLGITNRDLDMIPSEEVPFILGTTNVSSTPTPSTTSTPSTTLITSSPLQGGDVPSNIDTVALNAYWLKILNQVRTADGKNAIVLDQRLLDSASDWASYLGENGLFSHDRPDGSSMHEWIQKLGYDFTEYGEPGGWTTNYFSENIAWNYASGDQTAMEAALDEAMSMFLDEESWNGPHYRTVHHMDWNSVGVGFWFKPISSGKYQVTSVFHYGSLE